MKKKLSSSTGEEHPITISGTVKNTASEPLDSLTVHAYSQGIRSNHLLGKTTTDENGKYTISYKQKKPATVTVKVYDAQQNLLHEQEAADPTGNRLTLDIALVDDLPFTDTEFDRFVKIIMPVTEDIPLSKLSETDQHDDIGFIVKKTGLSKDLVEALAMAAHFETLADIDAASWYGILRSLPKTENGSLLPAEPAGFDTRKQTVFDSLMHTPVGVLLQALQTSMAQHIIAHTTTEKLTKLKEQLLAEMENYTQQHPVSGEPSVLHQMVQLGGLKGKELQSFLQIYNDRSGTNENFWQQVRTHPDLQYNKNIDQLQAVFSLSKFTGNNLPLMEELIQSGSIKSKDDLKNLAAYDSSDWETLLKNKKSKTAAARSKATTKNLAEDTKQKAVHLEAAFTNAFPTAAFAARLSKDAHNKLPHRDKITKFLQENEHFDLLNHQVNVFLRDNKKALPEQEAQEVAGHLQRIQRIFKLSPTYSATNTLLNGNIHSAHQIYKMGKDNFVNTYASELGEQEATDVFQKASQAHANAVALAGNLRAMADASAMNAFPKFSQALVQSLTTVLPNLETLFGHTDFFNTTESQSVYGAPAYLTDILHFLENRNSTLAVTGKTNRTKASVKDLLLQRRPDIGDIDLNGNNADTAIPYIDIACEIMEDYIAAPVVIIAASLLPKLVKGTIDAALVTAINTQLTTAGLTNINTLLTANATVSDKYTNGRLKTDNTFVNEDHWVIRDSMIAFRVTNLGAGGIECKVLHQTLLPAEAISTGPEYVNLNTYNNFLKTAKRPFILPFDLFETEGDMYLEKLGVKKAGLIETFGADFKTLTGTTATEKAIAYASLGINEAERTLITVADTANQTLYWGPDVTSTTTSLQVNIFEKLTGLNYQQVMDLISVVAPTVTVVHDDSISADGKQHIFLADTSKQRITNLTATLLDTIHRFLRLWRKTSFTFKELNAIRQSAIGGGVIDAHLVWGLQYFISLQQSLQVSAFELLAFYNPLDKDLYNQLFQNSAITNPIDPVFSTDKVYSGGGNGAFTAGSKAVIAAVLEISMSDLELLFAYIPNLNAIISDSISQLYRHARLARSLGLPVADFIKLLNLFGTSPFTNPITTYQFLEQYNALKSSGFSIDELNYILRHQDNSAKTGVPASDVVTTALTGLQDALLTIRAATQPATDPNGDLLNKWLQDPVLNWNTNLLNRLLDICSTSNDAEYSQKLQDNANFLINLRILNSNAVLKFDLPSLPVSSGVPIVLPASMAMQLSFDPDKKQLVLAGYMSSADRTALLALSSDTAYQNAINGLFNAAQQTDSSTGNRFFTTTTDITNGIGAITFANGIQNRFAYFINKIAPVYSKQLQQNGLVNTISTWFNTNKTVVNQLLLSVPAIYTDFTSDNFVNKIPATGNTPYPVQTNRYQLLAKICLITGRLKLTATDLAFLLSHAADISSLDFNALPVSPVAGGVSTYNSFATLIHLLKFQQYYPARVTNSSNNTTFSIYQVLNNLLAPGATLAGLISDLSLLTGWNATVLGQLVNSPNYLALSFPADYKSVRVLHRLHKCFVLLQQLGITVADAISWSAPSLAYADSQKIKQTLKAKYSNSDWAAVTTPLQNTLREKKRDALIAYLLANPGTQSWVTDNDLYSYFLLDVEMCSCQPTSRIVQATNSVQLFVQRCFLNLELNVAVITKGDTDVDSTWLQWPWMKNFRVWQANMKVFLYPENYIEPELLPNDIKSSFLKDMENDLLQNEATATNVEDAFHNYLEKLEAVARLEVKGMWYDWPSKTLHVFARTYGGNPRVYYHRRFINNKRWTPWEKIDLDISSDHIIPAVYNNRLYLFWAIFSEDAALPSTGIAVPKVGQEDFKPTAPVKSWIIQMAFSEYKNGKWTPKKISEKDNSTGRIVQDQSAFPDKASFYFSALDIPAFDYDKILDGGGQKITPDAFNQKALKAIQKNGKLVINCYYYKFIGNNSAGNSKYIGSFQLDPVKGYPTTLTVKYGITLQQSNYHLERTNRKSLLVNMLDVETFDGAEVSPPENGIPGSGPGDKPKILVAEQAGGNFSNLVPLQLDPTDRYNFLNNIYNNVSNTTIQPILGTSLPYFYQDQRRTYYIMPEWSDNGLFEYLYSDTYELTLTRLRDGSAAYTAKLIEIDDKLGLPHPGGTPTIPGFISRYFNFHHPLVDYFIQQLFANGINGLMDRTTQLKGDVVYDASTNKFDFKSYFQPVINGFNSIYSGAKLPDVINNTNPDKTPGYPKDDVDFNLQSGYGLYNWELFFHAPLMIAERLSQNQQFDEAERWYKYIFNPMDTSSFSAPNKYWNTRPFFLTTSTDYINERIDSILRGVNSSTTAGDPLIKNVDDWRNNPFQPHFIAQYRTVAYQKVAVMKYVDHLLRHGDYLFSQHTMESINEATQLYILASQILGPKPEVIPFVGKTAVDNYFQLETKLDALSDTLVNIENLLPQHAITGYTGVTPGAGLPPLQTLYFNIPMNEKLTGPTGYWDVVADRLFKIRHCLDIDGNLAPVSLFSAPIDPGMLVRATAAGLSIGSILNDVNAPLPLYRFMTMMQKAIELCNEVKSLGGLLLSVLEKKDAEALALLRSSHEINLLTELLEVKKNQVKDAQSTIDNLNKQKELITIRQQYYKGLIDEGWVLEEQLAMTLNGVSLLAEAGIALGYGLAGGLSLIPQFVIGASGLGSPVATASTGGQHMAAAADHATKMLSAIVGASDKAASILLTKSGYDRREDEWNFQKNLTDKELEQIEVQLSGANLRLEIANKDVANQQLQIDQATETDDFMHSKFTNEELFNWMSTQVSNTYFKSYQLAYETAKKAERCFRYELALGDSAYINFGYWDSLKKGLLAGEQLAYDIHKMELAYIDQNKREQELTKHISLSQLDPVALLKLKTTGECWINLPEEMFNMDYPGHYMRRIKSVSLTIPCIAGPYTTVSCKLTMTRNSMRVSGVAGSDYPRKQTNGIPADDPRFRDGVGALQSIATSHAQNDSGLFELNFRDERYLPFEGAGAISLWHLQLPAAVRQFDYNSISDAIIHLKYTARDGGEALKSSATSSLNAQINQMLVSLQDKGLMRIFSAKNDLSTEWYRFLHPVTPGGDQVFTLNLDASRFPLFAQGKTIKIKSIELVADSAGAAINNLHYTPASTTDVISLTNTGAYNNWANATIEYGSSKKDPGTWTITNPVSNPRLTDSNPQGTDILIKNMAIIVHYEIS